MPGSIERVRVRNIHHYYIENCVPDARSGVKLVPGTRFLKPFLCASGFTPELASEESRPISPQIHMFGTHLGDSGPNWSRSKLVVFTLLTPCCPLIESSSQGLLTDVHSIQA
eukprot:EG_transcript_29588